MADEEVFGNAGIDTDFERESINYRPTLETSTRKKTVTEFNETDEVEDNSIAEEEDLYPVTDTYIEIGNSYDYVKDLVDTLEQGLVHTTIPIAPEYVAQLENAEVEVDGIDDLSNGLPFEVYKESLNHPDNPTYSLIQDAVEDYAEDVDGNIALELYPDAVDVLNNIEELHYLLGKSLYNQVLPGTEPPSSPSFDEVFYEGLKTQEQEQYDAFTALNNLHTANEAIYYQLLTDAFETEAYFDALTHYNESKRERDKFVRQINQQKEMSSFGLIDTSMSTKIATRINRLINTETSIDETKIKSLLSYQYDEPQELLKATAQMQAATKLQVNKQIEAKQAQKDLLKTTGGLAIKKRVHDEVINLVNARNKIYLDLYDMMNNMVEPTRDAGVESFLNQVAQGMDLVRENHKTYLQEMYQVHMIDQEVRLDKVNLTEQKQIARESYSLLNNIQK